MREIRSDKILLDKEDICYSFKPMKMGIRMAHLIEGSHGPSFASFVETYDRVTATSEKLFRVTLTPEEREVDLDKFHQLYSTFKEHKSLVCDTVSILNKEIRNGKRILVEDSSSTSMDIDTGIYPFTDSFNTTTGAVCTGLGVPEEVIETSIGAFSAISVIDKSIYNRINYFPTEIREEDDPS